MPRQNTKIPDASPVHLTEGGLLRMKKRLVDLKASLPYLISEASQAAAQGDRSDNDAYKQSKSILRRTHRQIWSIEDQLKQVVVITSGRNAAGTVQLGSRVTLETDKKGQKIFEIVGSRETNPGRGRISHESPLGKMLLGHKERDTIMLRMASGEKKYKILEIH